MTAAAWRPLIQRITREVWPGLEHGPFWIEAQMQQESAGVANARSSAGAVGLLQLMPGTATDMGLTVVSGGLDERLNPEKNVRAGVGYLRHQYDQLPEITQEPARDLDRLYWAFASYNGGRGFVNKALALARERYSANSDWRSWEGTSPLLSDPRCEVVIHGRTLRPDAKQMTGYVAAIVRNYSALVASGL